MSLLSYVVVVTNNLSQERGEWKSTEIRAHHHFPVKNKMNINIEAASLFDCDEVLDVMKNYKYDFMWGQTLMGCKVLEILKDMYKFNVTYLYGDKAINGTYINDTIIDVYARPMELRLERLDDAYPILPIFIWRFGFLLRRPEPNVFRSFYSQPFSRPVWNCLYCMAILISVIFYLLNWCEKRLLGRRGECSILYELLVTIGAYCQHVLPVRAVLQSRRTAYFTFFIFTYVIYSFYASNLLSHLVSDKEEAMSLQDLAEGDYNYIILDSMQINIYGVKPCRNLSIVQEKLLNAQFMNVTAGLEALRTTKTALLTDFVTIYPTMKRAFTIEELCGLVEIDVWSNVKKYFFTSKHFPYKEQFKIGLLRAKEAGVLRRLIVDYNYTPRCAERHSATQTRLLDIISPLYTLGASFIASFLILLAELIHFNRNRLFPYVE